MDDSELEERIAKEVEEWSTNSNECFKIQLLRGDEKRTAFFQPEFTYPIFGDEEAIFGYQNLKIVLSFASHNLKPHLTISYDKKFKAQGEVQPTNILEALRDFLPEVAFSNAEDAATALQDPEAADFEPPGDMVHSYTAPDEVRYEVWKVDLSDPEAQEILENMQILVPMLIEGGTMLQLGEDWTTERWKIFLHYAVHDVERAPPSYSPYSLVGFGTSYRVFAFPDREDPYKYDIDVFKPSQKETLMDFVPNPATGILDPNAQARWSKIDSPLKLPSRERLSQFIVLPSFHRQGHGHELYHAMYTELTKDINVREFTVEDPNEAFDDLRDYSDMLNLRYNRQDFVDLKINTDIPAEKLKSDTNIPHELIVDINARDKLRRDTKIMPRQFSRLVEMQTLSKIPPLNRSRSRITRKEKATNEHDKAYYFWRLYVKQRLYLHNKDQLVQVEPEERRSKLDAACDSVLEGYNKMLEKLDAKGSERQDSVNGDASTVEGAAPRVRKRKVVDEDEDEDEETEDDQPNGANGHKKTRVE